MAFDGKNNNTNTSRFEVVTSYYAMQVSVCVRLTVGAAVDFDAQSDPSLLTPVQRDEPQETRHDPLLQLVADGALRVGVAGKGLRSKWGHDTP